MVSEVLDDPGLLQQGLFNLDLKDLTFAELF